MVCPPELTVWWVVWCVGLDQHKMAMEATQKLSGEKNALINTIKKLNRDVAKLESFKRNLMQTLRDDDDPVGLPQS
jgi:hypothetical protein